jgi:hypothetical protein
MTHIEKFHSKFEPSVLNDIYERKDKTRNDCDCDLFFIQAVYKKHVLYDAEHSTLLTAIEVHFTSLKFKNDPRREPLTTWI